jgi:hypothetical protein
LVKSGNVVFFLRNRFDARWHWKILGFQCVICVLPGMFLLWGLAPNDEHHSEQMGLLYVMAGPGLGLMLIIALWAWWRSFKYAQMIRGVPAVGRIASVAQGYVRLAGRGQLLPGPRTVSEPGSGAPCLWMRAIYNDRGQFRVDESDVSFLLDDGSGAVCAVDPEGAEMLVYRHRVFTENGEKVWSWCLRPGDPIYVLGELVTLGGIDTADLNTHHRTGELLARWKDDRAELLRRFDLDRDAQISMREWEQARAAARREVGNAQLQELAAPEAHFVRKPENGQRYLISDRNLDTLARQFWFWAIVHGAIFIAAAAALTWLYAQGGIR